MPTQELRTTKLEAVNSMLACVGESPINTLEGTLPANIQIAVDLLRNTSRHIQTRGWNFNTEEDVELSRDSDGKIPLPGNCLDVDLTTEDGTVDVIMMGDFLYDKLNHTFVFGANQKCTIIYFRAWEELCEAARGYIKVSAARIYQDQTVGSETHHQFSAQDEAMAFSVLNSSNAESCDATIFDTAQMAGIVNRRRPLVTQFPN